MNTKQHDVEQQLREFMDPGQPSFWLSERIWSCFSQAYEFGSFAFLVLPLQSQIRQLAERHQKQPRTFKSAMDGLLKGRARKLGFAWQSNASSHAVATDNHRLSDRQILAVANVIPVLRRTFTTLSAPNLLPSEKNSLAKFFASLLAETPGRKPGLTTSEILRIAADLRAQNRTLSLGEIANLAYPDYVQLSGDQRHDRRQKISRILKRHGFSSVLSGHQ